MRRTFWVFVTAVLATFLLTTGTAEAAKSITAPDMGERVGLHTSMVLDGNGYPVAAYCAGMYPGFYSYCSGDLKILRCDNTTCSTNSIASIENVGLGGGYASLVLDSNGYPVVSYYQNGLGGSALKLLHCGNANCTAGNSIQSIESSAFRVGLYTSLALDGSGNPVVSYYDQTNGDLKVAHCNDANCDPAVPEGNGAESKTTPDSGGDVGQYTSLALSGGKPLISYYDAANGDLKVLNCGNANCTSGNSITSPDTANNVGAYTSLALSFGNPVVSYYDVTNGDLKVLLCGNPDCTGETFTLSLDTAGAVGAYTSLEMDGYLPVITYYDLDNGDLKVLHCGSTDCLEDNSIISPDTTGNVGQYTSVAVSAGNPVVSYYDVDHGSLKVLRCGNANCTSGNTATTADTGGDVGWYTSLALDSSGYPVITYFDYSNEDLKVLHCGNANCTSDNSITSPDTAGTVGEFTSLVLDGSGNPVVSYYDRTHNYLKVLHCDDPNCAPGGDSITSPDTAGGEFTSLALDGSGKPVVSYYKPLPSGDLKVLHCDDVNCSGNESGNITSPDTANDVGTYTSLKLDGSGNPVVSYHDTTNMDLKVLHCDDVNCSGNESGNITSPDQAAGVGLSTSLALDAAGNPVVSYWQSSLGDLRVLHCDDVNCSGNESGNITSPDTANNVGLYSSLKLDGSGYPVVSYYDYTNGNLKVLHCDDVNCSGNESGNITSPDTPGDVGRYTSLRLDSQGNPVVSYYDKANGDLKVLHCDTPNCTVPASYPPAGTDEMPVSLHFANVWLDEDDNGVPETNVGAATFSGTGKFSRGTPYPSGGYNTIDTAITSMVLTGTVHGYQVTIKAGTEQELSASLGKIREQTPGTLYPADTWFDLFFEVDSADPLYDKLWNCNGQSVRLNGVTMAIPAAGVDYLVPSCPLAPPPASCAVACQGGGLLGDGEVMPMSPMRMCTGYDPAGNAIWVSVGGIAEWPGTAAGPDSLADSSAGSGFNYTALGAALGAVAVALAAGAWFARRRWTR